jgi:hypothetical protein
MKCEALLMVLMVHQTSKKGASKNFVFEVGSQPNAAFYSTVTAIWPPGKTDINNSSPTIIVSP